MEHSLCLSYSHIHISFSVCFKVWVTSCVEPDTICVSDDGPKTHMTQYLKGMVPKAYRVYKVGVYSFFQ